jgi:D-aminopeptidase
MPILSWKRPRSPINSPPPKVVVLASPNGAGRQAAADSHKLAIEAAMREAVNDAVVAHQRLGLPMVEWQNGRIVWIPADQLAADGPKPTP